MMTMTRSEKAKLREAKWYKKNREKLIIKQQEYYQRNREERIEYAKEWYRFNREKVLLRMRLYKKRKIVEKANQKWNN